MATTLETDAVQSATPEQDDASSPTRGRRLGISVLIVLVLLGMLASTAPRSEIKNGLLDLTRPFLLATGLDQTWGVFAPSPPQMSNEVIARVDRADGTVGVYTLVGGDGVTEYWDYRWRKYGEQLWQEQSAEQERAAFARWFAQQDSAAGHEPSRVTLVRVVRPNLPAGPGPDTGPSQDIPFFTTPVSSR